MVPLTAPHLSYLGPIQQRRRTPKGNDDDVGGTAAGLVISSGRRVAEAPSKSKSTIEIEMRRHQATSLRLCGLRWAGRLVGSGAPPSPPFAPPAGGLRGKGKLESRYLAAASAEPPRDKEKPHHRIQILEDNASRIFILNIT